MTDLPDPNCYKEQDPPEVELVPGQEAEYYIRWRQQNKLTVCRGYGDNWGYYPSGETCGATITDFCTEKLVAYRRRARWAQSRNKKRF